MATARLPLLFGFADQAADGPMVTVIKEATIYSMVKAIQSKFPRHSQIVALIMAVGPRSREDAGAARDMPFLCCACPLVAACSPRQRSLTNDNGRLAIHSLSNSNLPAQLIIEIVLRSIAFGRLFVLLP